MLLQAARHVKLFPKLESGPSAPPVVRGGEKDVEQLPGWALAHNHPPWRQHMINILKEGGGVNILPQWQEITPCSELWFCMGWIDLSVPLPSAQP